MKRKVNKPGQTVALKIVQKSYPQVTKVVDAKKPVVITLTPEDSQVGQKRDHKHCAMALACQRQEHADGVIMSMKAAYIIKGSTAFRYIVPASTSREVVSFDRSGGFNPGQYQLSAPTSSNKLGHWYGGPLGPRYRKPVKKLRVRHVTNGVRTSLNHGVKLS